MNICILMPVLNGAWRLDAALSSVRSQSYANWRLIVLDGGSQDGSLEIARRHAVEDARIEVRSGPDDGMYDALRRGFDGEASATDLFAWLNADDMYTPWAFAEAVRTMKRGARWVTGIPALWDSEGALRCVLPRGGYRRWAIRAGWAHDGCLGAIQQESIFFSAELYTSLTQQERDVFARQRLAGDFHLWRCFARRAELETIASVLGGFRLHDRNQSRLKQIDYAAELKALGAATPPEPIARLMRRLSDRAGAWGALRAFEKAAHQLDLETRGEAP
jgi:glycosyltransferase involved in cell wall biosynthesis